MENFNETYIERARRLREQLANLQPIPSYEESQMEIEPDVENMHAEIKLPSQHAFMKESFMNSSVPSNMPVTEIVHINRSDEEIEV